MCTVLTCNIYSVNSPNLYSIYAEAGELTKANTPLPRKFEIVKSIDMIATAYDLSVVSCGKKRKHKEYGITFTGTKATVKRTVAVDPDTIPLGSRLLLVFEEGKYAKYNGEYIAEDTGSDVKGNIIDIFLGEDKPGSNVIAKEVDDFWSKQVIVYIIK